MQELAICCTGSVVKLDAESTSDIDREFEQRLADCSTLAFRVAMGVLPARLRQGQGRLSRLRCRLTVRWLPPQASVARSP